MSEEPNTRFNRPIRATRSPGAPKKPQPERSPKGPAMTPELEAWLRKNAPQMTGQEVAHAMGVCYQEARKRCHELGVKWKERSETLQPNAAEKFEPATLPPGETLDAPRGSAARVAKLRERAEKGVELWDYHDDARPLPRCAAKIEKANMEAIS